MVQLVSSEYADEAISTFDKVFGSEGVDLPPDMREEVRIVLTSGALREKAMILRDGLDDRVIEVVKAMLKVAMLNKDVSKGVEGVRYIACSDDGIVFEPIGEGGMHVLLPHEVYGNAKTILKGLLRFIEFGTQKAQVSKSVLGTMRILMLSPREVRQHQRTTRPPCAVAKPSCMPITTAGQPRLVSLPARLPQGRLLRQPQPPRPQHCRKPFCIDGRGCSHSSGRGFGGPWSLWLQ